MLLLVTAAAVAVAAATIATADAVACLPVIWDTADGRNGFHLDVVVLVVVIVAVVVDVAALANGF